MQNPANIILSEEMLEVGSLKCEPDKDSHPPYYKKTKLVQ